MPKRSHPLAAMAVAASLAFPASAETVRFEGTLEAGCTMVVQDGVLAASSDYTILSSEEPGGESATLDVTPLGGAVQIQFSPILFVGTGLTFPDTTEIKWRTQSGFSRGYSDLAPQSYLSFNPEIYEIDVRAIRADGFNAGSYQMITIATCTN